MLVCIFFNFLFEVPSLDEPFLLLSLHITIFLLKFFYFFLEKISLFLNIFLLFFVFIDQELQIGSFPFKPRRIGWWLRFKPNNSFFSFCEFFPKIGAQLSKISDVFLKVIMISLILLTAISQSLNDELMLMSLNNPLFNLLIIFQFYLLIFIFGLSIFIHYFLNINFLVLKWKLKLSSNGGELFIQQSIFFLKFRIFLLHYFEISNFFVQNLDLFRKHLFVVF